MNGLDEQEEQTKDALSQQCYGTVEMRRRPIFIIRAILIDKLSILLFPLTEVIKKLPEPTEVRIENNQ